MPKKRRSDSHGSPFAERKNKYEKEADVTTARHRLTGVLQELLNSDEESSSSQEEPQAAAKPVKKEVKQRRRKRKAPVDQDPKFKNTFVMKMFDRSVDLAQFREGTPLYPICRAWIANTPSSMPEPILIKEETEVKMEQEEQQDEMFDFETEEMQKVHKLPPPSAPAPKSRIPPLPPTKLREVNLEYGEDLPSAKDLLQEHRKRWTSVKKNWADACLKNESRFAESGKILSHIFKNTQLNFSTTQ